MIVAGVMSGTSADGVNVALVRLPAFKLLGHAEYAYPRAVRQTVLGSMNASAASVADLARLNFLLGELYAKAVVAAEKKFRVRARLIGCHGQTLYHQGKARKFLGHSIRTTWQTGEAAVIAARTMRPVVSDFRPADMAAGGQGAPLVSYFDYFFYRDRRRGRVLQNIGGIANLTAIAAGASPEQVIAFDTGPGNMVIDALAQRLFRQAFDRNGRLAARGRPLAAIVEEFLRAKFFLAKPPKTTGREEFGREFAARFLARCGRAEKHDVIASATSLTARSIAQAVERFLPRGKFEEMIVAGGGAKNLTLMAMLAGEVKPLGTRLRTSDDFGLPAAAKEAAAFALLAFETWRRKPSNVRAATGARRAAILGKISYA